jgi:hypothetical protein
VRRVRPAVAARASGWTDAIGMKSEDGPTRSADRTFQKMEV